MSRFAGQSVRKLETGSPVAKRAAAEIVRGAAKQVFVDGFFHG